MAPSWLGQGIRMFCYQCEQTARGTGCIDRGTCGKSDEVAALQDLLLRQAMGLAICLRRVPAGAETGRYETIIEDALFTTVTNVNFDADRLEDIAAGRGQGFGRASRPGRARRPPGRTVRSPPWRTATSAVGTWWRRPPGSVSRGGTTSAGADIVGLQELLTSGLKGMAAYGHHARFSDGPSAKVTAFLSKRSKPWPSRCRRSTIC